MKIFWIILVGSKLSGKYFYKSRQIQRKGRVKIEAESGVMQPQAKGCLEPAEPKREGRILPQSLVPP